MIRSTFLLTFLLFAFSSIQALPEAANPALPQVAEKTVWPGGVNPDSLLLNTDPEPDLNSPGFVDIFNGHDLSGWSIQGGKMLFEVHEGTIVGTNQPNQPNSFLCTDKVYQDFIFTTEFKWSVRGNSGIMFRADTEKPNENGIRYVFGYQVEMDSSDRSWSGGVYGERMGGWKYPLSKEDEHAKARAAINDCYAWNRLTILAQGNVIKTWINGVPCAYLINDERAKGFFGLQVHAGKAGTILWKKIMVKEL